MVSLFDNLGPIEEALEKGRFGLFTDVDGTISPVAPTPAEASVSPECRRYLSILSHRLTLVAAVSGRALDDVRQMVGLDGLVYIGNHGLEQWVAGRVELTQGAADFPRRIEAVSQELGTLLERKGVFLENKGATATIHYRLCPEPERIEADLLEALAKSSQAESFRIKPGKMCLNILPALKVDKGTATGELIRRFKLESAVYMGDDITDLDAFRAIKEAAQKPDFRGFAVAVTGRETVPQLKGQADFTLKGVAEVERFLRWLSQRAASPGQ